MKRYRNILRGSPFDKLRTGQRIEKHASNNSEKSTVLQSSRLPASRRRAASRGGRSNRINGI